ncbi:MAG: hypothetical protein PF638_03875 [Candidatus Delongbacteria bacterium]|jgi:hypothetical protein|nr:hypothetical protein [Candidatus Delongbacteria bacterium]
MKKFLVLVAFMVTLNLFAVYNIGDPVLPADDLAWTDNFDYSSSVFDEITSQEKVVVLFFGGSIWYICN